MNNHPFHLVNKSPWPIILSFSIFSITLRFISFFYKMNIFILIFNLILFILILTQWWRDVVRESTFQGLHTKKVALGLKYGIILFIFSEIIFFSSFFWAFFHRRLSPSIDIGIIWPPKCIKPFNPIGIPLLNTIILLSSGISLTWAHRAIINNNYTESVKRIILTIVLGIYFSLLQITEYYEAPFSISDSVFGSTFFISTGFHGLHVLIGTIFIFFIMLRLLKLHFSKTHHVGFECSAWYWHFVDVVWLFLYLNIYWWGSYLFNIKSIISFQLESSLRNK